MRINVEYSCDDISCCILSQLLLCSFSRRALIRKKVECFVGNNRSSIIPSKTSDTILKYCQVGRIGCYSYVYLNLGRHDFLTIVVDISCLLSPTYLFFFFFFFCHIPASRCLLYLIVCYDKCDYSTVLRTSLLLSSWFSFYYL